MINVASVRVVHCVVCDDVRLEIGNKETIVGAYTAGMTVPHVPWSANVCLWITVIWSGEGELSVEIRVLNPRHQQVATTRGAARAIWQGNESSLTFRGIVFSVEMEGIYGIQWRVGGRDWEPIRQFPVYIARA